MVKSLIAIKSLLRYRSIAAYLKVASLKISIMSKWHITGLNMRICVTHTHTHTHTPKKKKKTTTTTTLEVTQVTNHLFQIFQIHRSGNFVH